MKTPLFENVQSSYLLHLPIALEVIKPKKEVILYHICSINFHCTVSKIIKKCHSNVILINVSRLAETLLHVYKGMPQPF